MKKTFLIGFLVGVIVVGGFEISYWQKVQSDIITVQAQKNLEIYIADFEKETVNPLETQITDFYAFMKDKKVDVISKSELTDDASELPNLQTSVIMDLPELHEKEVSIYWPNLEEAQDAAFPIFIKGKGRNVFKNSEFQVDVYYMKDGNKRMTNMAFASCNFDGNLCSDDSHDLMSFRANLNLENSPVCDLFMDFGPVGRKSDNELFLEKVPLTIYNIPACNPVVEESVEVEILAESTSEESTDETENVEVLEASEVVVKEKKKVVTEEEKVESPAPVVEKVEEKAEKKEVVEEVLKEEPVVEAKPEEREAVKKFPWN